VHRDLAGFLRGRVCRFGVGPVQRRVANFPMFHLPRDPIPNLA